MRSAEVVAKKLWDAGIRLKSVDELGALYLTPDHLKREFAALWLDELNHDVEINVCGTEVKTLGAQQAWNNAVFEVMQSSDFLGEVDSELWAIQTTDIRECAA